MVCLIELKDGMVTTAMWIFTIILGIGIIVLLMQRYGNKKWDECFGGNLAPILLVVGFIGSMLIGIAGGDKKREGFCAIYGL